MSSLPLELFPFANNPLYRRFANTLNWINWKGTPTGKKIPRCLIPGDRHGNKPTLQAINSRDSRYWLNFQDAYKISLEWDCGIGFVPVNTPVACIDCDIKGINDSAILASVRAKQEEICNDFDTYIEMSPSGGQHCWFELLSKDNLPGYKKLPELHLELFINDNYVTVDPTKGNGKPLEQRQDKLLKWFSESLSNNGNGTKGQPTGGDDGWSEFTPAQSDDVVIRLASEGQSGETLKKLYWGQWSGLYGSPSEAELAFCNILAPRSRNKQQVARIWRSSQLGQREKVQERNDYLVRTINTAFDKLPTQTVQSSFNPFIFKTGSEYTPQPVDWLRKNYLARRKITLLAGESGTAKTSLALSWSARISTGGTWPDNSGLVKQGFTLVYSIEDDPEDTLVPRFMAHDGNLDRIVFLEGRRNEKGEPIPFDPTTDFQLLLEYVRQFDAGIDLLIIDPIITIVKGDANQNNKVRQALQPISELAKQLNCAVVAIIHFGKDSHGRKVLDRVLHSGAFVQLSRVVLNTVRVQDSDELWLVKSKVSNGVPGGGVSYRIEPITVAGNIETTRIVETAPLHGDPNELIAKAEGTFADNSTQTQVGKARELLLEMLKGRPCLQSEILIAGENRGISPTALQNAKKQLNVINFKYAFQGPSWWKLPLGTK
jgi:hypothetical protein